MSKAGYETNPLKDGSLALYRLIPIDITGQNATALKDSGLSRRISGVAKISMRWALFFTCTTAA